MVTDFLLDQDGDLLIRDGDFAVGESDDQHIEDIITAFPGWWKQFPLLGVGIFQNIKSSQNPQDLERSIKINLQSDGYDVSNARVAINGNGKMEVSPNAVRL